jgi:MoCo/4Fe-4S cofactor protein with predicted Tat translocation signal
MTDKTRDLDLARFRSRLESEQGPKYWRSLDELAEDDSFQEFLKQEFPEQAHAMDDGVDRRSFVKLMSASFAMAGLAACKLPPEQIVPYVQKPEEIIPGKPLYFATAMPVSGVATGLLVESHMGRPTKIEGNPQHPASLGASDAYHQASVLGLYDPDRSDAVRYLGEVSTWTDFLAALQRSLAALKPRQGAGFRLLTETITSPSLGDLIRKTLAQYPQAVWHQYEPLTPAVHDTVYHFERANVIVALDSDILGSGPGHLRYARDYASRRRLSDGARTMNRLYAVGPQMTVTSSIADNRLPIRASEVEGFAASVLQAVGGAASGGGSAHQPWIAALAKDLLANRGASIVVAGDDQPATVRATVDAINAALGNVGQTVTRIAPLEVQPVDQLQSLRTLVADMQAGRVQSLVMLGGNPVYNAPADFNFAAALNRVPFRAHLSAYYDETSERCHWHIPDAHYLESWGDARAYDGTVSIIQPLIAPLYNGRSAWEVMGGVLGDFRAPHDIIRDYWRANAPQAASDDGWRKILHDGAFAAPVAAAAPAVVPPATPRSAQTATGLEIIFTADPNVYDGRFGNIGWLQEAPRPMTKISWDNVAMFSPNTARRLGLQTRDALGGAVVDMVEIELAGRRVEAPIWIVPGQADDTVVVALGLGRTRAGRVGNNVGFNAYALRTSSAMRFASGVQVRKTGNTYKIACTQGHFRMEDRGTVQAAPLATYLANPGFARGHDAETEHLDLYPEYPYDEYRWGMAVDTSVCTGCNGCVIACQAENNIPIVGKSEVLRQREMHWLRIDRYFEGDAANPAVYNQPVMCQHCEKAPCEPVCPVEATSHSDDGLNDMTYNRCIGTRYCSNNCPYKVRRFNFLAYSDFDTESLKLQRNPDVTVRSRGVMEKCTYCVQRIREGRRQAEKEGRKVRDGEVVTACQAACPTQAIVFGDINDSNSRVAKLKNTPLNYGMLTELNTQPRTSYLATVRNPNPEIPAEQA